MEKKIEEEEAEAEHYRFSQNFSRSAKQSVYDFD